MRPEWLKCGNCLWYTDSVVLSCGYNNQPISTFSGYFCSNWTCANCWQTWDDVDHPAINASTDVRGKLIIHDLNAKVYTDHSQCKAVVFGVKNV